MTGVLLTCVVTATVLMVRREVMVPAPPAPVRVAEWKTFTEQGRWIGQKGAPVTIVVWSDFECPACRALWSSLRTLQGENPARFAVLYRHEPLSFHQHALAAARASECAGLQGRFSAYHDALFQHQEQLREERWDRFATEANVPDLAEFARCMSSTRPDAAIARDMIDGRSLGVGGTPTLLINGKRFDGAPPLAELREQIASAAAEATKTNPAR